MQEDPTALLFTKSQLRFQSFLKTAVGKGKASFLYAVTVFANKSFKALSVCTRCFSFVSNMAVNCLILQTGRGQHYQWHAHARELVLLHICSCCFGAVEHSFLCRMFASLLVVVLGLRCGGGSDSGELLLGSPKLSGPSEALVTDIVNFFCELPNHPQNESIELRLLKKGDRPKHLGEYTSLRGEVGPIPKRIQLSHEGYLVCVASVQNNSAINSTVSQTHYLKVIEPVKGAQIIPSGPVELFEGGEVELQCKLSAGNHVSFMWLRDGQIINPSLIRADDSFVISRATSKDSGSYICVATNTFNGTNVFNASSPELLVTVKARVSNPDISFTVFKESYQSYFCVVSCQSTRGTPPIRFSLFNGTDLVSNVTVQERRATFKIPVVLDQHLGLFQCQASNSNRTASSRWIPLEIVPVGGPVTMHLEYDMAENYEVIYLRLYCKPERGSHPSFQWYLNKNPLHDQGSFYYVFNQLPGQSILLVSVGEVSAGRYHCEVSDSFDNSTVINSKRCYLDRKVLNHIPALVVGVVFGCFSVIVLLVSACCAAGVIFRRRRYVEATLLTLEKDQWETACEDELELSMYGEDVVTGEEAEFDHASEDSVDDWIQYKKILEEV
ncbi:hemicentin-1 isoform X2 [Oryzias melastigma]|uniref:hemicentin-1 isoform X2 n=1 Tax=Oryzias melastigma TaxID=30732 RepID=UPI00168D2722|nr:hemicentin-1 isoform X2 [Oryzias melastigma]